MSFKRSASWSLPFVLTLSPVAFAQDGNPGDRVVLEEVLVTATKRERAIDDIPVAISAYGGEQLQKSGIRDVGQIVQVNPSVNFGTSETSSSGNLSIRGVGTLGTDPGLESSVGVFIDGVYRNRSGVAIDELGGIERIEVLRGPQGSLFGRNTSAGLIHVITKGPNHEEHEGHIELQIGSENLKRLSFASSGPLTDNLAGRVDAVITERDGYLKNINSGEDLNNRDRFMVRGQLAWDIGEDTSVRVIADMSEREEFCCGAPTSRNGGGGAVAAGIPLNNPNDQGLDNDEDPYDHRVATTTGRDMVDDTEQWGISAEINHTVNDTTDLISITAFRDWQTWIGGDLDWSGADLFYYPENAEQQRAFETFTQELRLQGAWEGGTWLVGLFYSDETLSGEFNPTYGVDLNTYTGALVDSFTAPGTYASGAITDNNFFIPGQGIRDVSEQDSESIAIFTQNDFDLSEDTVLTVGLRYTTEEKEIELATQSTFQYIPGGGGGAGGNPCLGAALTQPGGAANPLVQLICGISALTNPTLNMGGTTPATYTADRSDDELTGTIKLAHTLEDDTLVFVNVARGFKSGGFNQSRLGLNSSAPNGENLDFDRELADTVELGVKTKLLDDRAAVNATLFYSEFSDFQLSQFNGATLLTSSVDTVETQGIEIEGTFQATKSLRFNGGLTYVDNLYPDDSIDEVSAPGTFPRGGKRRGVDWTATASMLHTSNIGDNLVGTLYLDARYQGESNSNASLHPEFDQSDYVVMNGRYGISDMARSWSLEVWARNLLDTEYTPISFNPPPVQGQIGSGRIADFIGEPRMLGLTARRNF